MPEEIPEFKEVVIPWWQDGKTTSETLKEPYFLSKGVNLFFLKIKGWLLFPLQQTDPLTCSESLLELKAWEKDINRFEGEPISLFRKRVKYAAINAKDAGSVAGFKAIFERLDVGIIAFKERENEDWDVCTIEVTDDDLSQNSALLQTLIEQYGRTCRRYRFEVIYPEIISISGGEFVNNKSVFVSESNIQITVPEGWPPTPPETENKNYNVLGQNVLGQSVLG